MKNTATNGARNVPRRHTGDTVVLVQEVDAEQALGAAALAKNAILGAEPRLQVPVNVPELDPVPGRGRGWDAHQLPGKNPGYTEMHAVCPNWRHPRDLGSRSVLCPSLFVHFCGVCLCGCILYVVDAHF